MRLRRITLQHFRNIAGAELAFASRRQFFAGANGQGKTSLLEAAGFITALRSFRTADPAVLIAHGQPEAALACELDHERLGPTRVVIRLRPGSREVSCDGERVPRIADYLGRFPTVVFTAQDLQLIRGAPALRRRWLDLTLAAIDAGYLAALQSYHRALDERNRLLKLGGPPAELAAFEHPLAAAAAVLGVKRGAALAELTHCLAAAYGRIAAAVEPAAVGLAPVAPAADADGWRRIYADGRTRDLRFRTTLAGPHRDDLEFTLGGRSARDFGSEGEQRSLMLALRLAQADFFQARSGVEPVLLADDVLGELDAGRRERFWAAVGSARQVLATGTRPPDTGPDDWERFRVAGGAFAMEASGA